MKKVLAVVLVLGALSACTSSKDDAKALIKRARDAFDPAEAAKQQLDATRCADGLRDLVDHPYRYPADPSAIGPDGQSWTARFDAYERDVLPSCNAVGAFLDARGDLDVLSRLSKAVGGDGAKAWASYFSGTDGIVAIGKRISEECPAADPATFDCEQASALLAEAAGQADVVMAQVGAVVAPAADDEPYPSEEKAAAAVADAVDQPVDTKVEGDTLTVADDGTDLAGMEITSSAITDDLDLGVADGAAVPEIPKGITPVSDVFAVAAPVDDAELRFTPPDGVSIEDLRLYGFVQPLDGSEPLWSQVWSSLSQEGTGAAPVLVVSVDRFEGLAFWGREAKGPQGIRSMPTGSASVGQPAQAATGDVSCTPTVPAGMSRTNPGQFYLCTTASDPAVKITIQNFGTGTTRWAEKVTKERLAQQIVRAMAWTKAQGYGFDKVFNISIEPLTGGRGGFVSYDTRETLHLTNDDKSGILQVAAHEYFHHVQFHPDTVPQDEGIAFGSEARNWLMEGGAEWMVEEAFDADDLYYGLGKRLAEKGMNVARPKNGPPFEADFPYFRSQFWKLFTRSCPNFVAEYPTILDVKDTNKDPSGVFHLEAMMDGALKCDFGSHLGADRKSSLAAALTYFNYATQFENRLSLLDANEKDTRINFDKPAYLFKDWSTDLQKWVSGRPVTATLTGIGAVPPVGAYSFEVPALAGPLPAGKVAVLTVESAQPLAVSVVSKDPGFVGTTTIGPDKVPATGFDTAERSTFVYGTTGTVPRLFVTMANGVTDPLKFANPKVTFTIRDRAASDDAPTAPSTTRGPSASTTTSTSTAPTTTAPTTTTAAPSATTTTPVASGGCPGASVAGPTPAADAAKLRCLIDAARKQAGLPVTATNSSADYFALLAAGSAGINPSGVCSGKAPKSWSKGAVPVATAQRAFDALGGMNNKYVNSTTATLLGIGVGNRAFGFFQARC